MILNYLKIYADNSAGVGSIKCKTLDGGKAKVRKLVPCTPCLVAVYPVSDDVSESLRLVSRLNATHKPLLCRLEPIVMSERFSIEALNG